MEKLSAKDKTIHDQFSAYGRNAKEWMNKSILLLPQVEKNQIWAKKGFSNIYEYARKLAGMSRNKVNESLRILGKTENLPTIRKMIEQKGIFAVKPVVNIVTPETEEFWAKRAAEMNKSTLETFVRDFKKEQSDRHITNYHSDADGRPGAGSPTSNGFNKPNLFAENIEIDHENFDSRIQVSMKIEPEIIDVLKKIKGENDWNETMKKILEYYEKGIKIEQKKLEEEERRFQEELVQEKPAAIKSKNHTVSVAIQRYIKKRSRDMCEHPNCNKKGEHIHHTEPFALRKVHDPDKLVYLCSEHHQIVHLGYIDDSILERNSASSLQFLASPQSKKSAISWKQIEKLPSYDIKNIINERIASFEKYYH